MSGNEFSEWPDVHVPSGSHDIGDAKIYDFPLTGDDRVAEKDSYRGPSVDSVGVSMATVNRRDSRTDTVASWSVSPRLL